MGAFDDLVTPPVAPAAPVERTSAGAFDDLIQPPSVDPDELGIGQEVRGVYRAAKRGLAGLGQVTSAMDLIMRQKAIDAVTPKPGQDDANWATGGEPGTVTKVARFIQDSPVARAFRATQEVGKVVAAKGMGTMEKVIQATPTSPDMEGLKDNFWSTFLLNPVETVSTVMAESIPQMAPGMLVGMALGPGGVVTGAGLNSFAVEYANSIMDTARSQKVDLTKPEEAMAFFGDKRAMDSASQKAVLRGVPVAVFDAATAGIAGRFLEPALGKGSKEVLKATGKELGAQMVGGAAGEAGGQLASEGKITSVPDIALEALAEIGSAPAEIRGNLRDNAKIQAERSAATSPTPPAQAPPVIQVDPRRWSGTPDLDSGLVTSQYTLPDRATFRALAGSDEAGDAQFAENAETPFDAMVRTADRRRRYVPQMDLSTLGLRDSEGDGTSPTTPVDMLMLDARTPQPKKRSTFEIPLISRPAVTVADPMDVEEPAPVAPAAPIELNPRRLALPERTSDPAPDVYDPAAAGRAALEQQDAARERRRVRKELEARATFGTTVGPTGVIQLPEETPDPIHISGRLFRYGVNLNWLNPYPVHTVEGPGGEVASQPSPAIPSSPTESTPAPAAPAKTAPAPTTVQPVTPSPLPVSKAEPAAAVAAEVSTPEVVKQSVPPLAPKAQKSYLMAELDRAIKEAPSDEYPEQSTARVAGDNGPTEDDLAANRAAFDANRAKFGTVIIEVPGDGTFEIFNTTKSLRAFKEKAKKFPVSQPKPPASGNRSENPTAIPAVGKGKSEDAILAATPFVTTDETRPMLMGLWSDGKQTVSTDGRGMLILNRGIGGSEKNPILLTPKGEPVTDSNSEPIPGSKYPNWKQVIPGEGSGAVLAADLDSARLLTVLHQASQGTNEKNKGVVLWRNPDGSVGVNFTAPWLKENPVLEYSHNVQEGAKFVGMYDPRYLIGTLEAMRRMGSDKVTLRFSGKDSPLSVVSKAGKAFIMPMRVDGNSPMPDHQLTVEDLTKPVTAAAPNPAAPATAADLQRHRERSKKMLEAKAQSIATVKEAAGPGTSKVELTSTKKPNIKLVVHREPTSTTKWRVTRFDGETPTGHNVFATRSAALAAAAGDSHSKEVSGPAHYAFGEFVVTRVVESKPARKAGEAVEKSGRVDAPLSPEQAAVLATLEGAKPGTPQARLAEFLKSGIKAVVEAAVAKFAKGVSGADDYVYARLFREAIGYLEKKGDFKIGIGGYGAQRAADNFAKNAATAADGTKAQVSKGSVSVDQPVGEDGATVGDVVAAEALDPAQAAVESDRRERMAPELKKVIEEVRTRFDEAGEGGAFDAALKEVAGIEGGPVTPKDAALARKPEFQKRVMAEVRSMVEASLGDLSALRTMLYSRINPTGESIGEDAVRSAAEEMTGGPLPENIQLVNLPDELTPDGSRWDARVIMGPDGWVIQLNIPHLTSADQVRTAMLHEAVHVVWEDARIQREVSAVSKAMEGTPGAGTTEEERIEEATVSAVVDQWRSNEAKSAWKRLVSAVWSAVERVVGIEPPASERAKSVIAATALQALKGGRVGVARAQGNKSVRYSRWNQAFRSMNELHEALTVPGLTSNQQEDLKSAASAAGDLVSPGIRSRMASMFSGDRVDKAAARALGFLDKLGEMAGMSPFVSAPDISARSALEADIYISGRIEGLRRQLHSARERLAKVLADLPLANQKDIEAVMAGSHADQLLRGYREYLAAERTLTGPKGTVASAKQQALDAAEFLLGSIVRDQPASIRTALEAVARVMPTGLPDSPALHAWLVAQERAGFPEFGGTKPMTDAVWTFMVKGDPGAGVAPAVLNAPAILGKLTDLQSIQTDRARALQVRDRFTTYLSNLTNRVHSNVSSDQFAREYAALIQAKQAAADEAASIYDALDRVDVRIRSLIRAIAIAEQAQLEPEYRSGMAAAVRQLDQRFSGIIRFPETTDHRLLGTMQIDGPQSGNAFDFDWAPNPEATRRNIQNAQTLLAEIHQYMARPDAEPGRVAVYRDRVIPLLEGKFMADLKTQIIGAHDSPRIPLTPHWLFKLPFAAGVSALKMFSHFFPGNSPRTVVYNMLGGTAGRTLLEYMGRTDLAHNGIRNADANPKTSSVRQKALAIAAAKAHGFISNRYVQFGRQGRTAAESILDWSEMVLNPLFARNQNPGGAPLRVGDWTPTGHKITAADLAVAQAQKGYTDAIHRALQRGANALMQMLPAQTQVDQYFRNAVDYGLKMARGESQWGKSFARRWDVARRADEDEAMGSGTPVYRRREALLREDPRDTNLAINGWWGTTNPEYWSGYTDKVQMQIANELAADRGNRHTFDSYDAFLDHFAAEREAIINGQAGVAQTTVAEERERANERFMADMDRATRSVQGGTAALELPSRDAEGVGASVANATSAKSSLTNPRGRMVAPDSFYEYTITDDGSRLTFNSQAMLYFQKQELDVLRAVLAALRTERDRLDAEYAKAVPPGNLRGRLLNEWQYRRTRNSEIRAGRAITRRADLTSIIEVLENTAKGIEANMKAGDLDQNRLLQTARAAEAVVSVAKLMSLPVQYANIVAAAFNAPAFNGYAIDQGKLGLLGALAQGVRAGGYLTRQFGRVFMDLADRAGVGNVVRRNPTAWMGLASAIHESAMRRRADIDYLRSAGFAIPESWGQATQRSALGVQLPETGGMVTRDTRQHPIGNPVAGVARLLSIPFQAMAFIGGQATSVGEIIGVQVQNELATSFMESLKPAILRAFEARERSLPDWNDTSKPLAPLLPEELGLGTFKSLNEIRRMFANTGQLENLFLDWYQRAKAAGAQGLSQPLLSPELERILRLDMQKQGNIISDSGKADALKRKGWAGLASAIMFRFQQYPIMLTGYINDRLAVDPRDEGAAKILRQEAATLALLTMLSALAMAGLGGRQWLTEAVTGKVPAASTMTSFSANPTALNFAKMMMAGGANLFLPYWGDQVNKLLSGQSPRPGLDLAAVIPGVGAVAQVMAAAQKMAQTHDALQPTVDLTKALFPATEAVLNRLPGLREDLVTQNAGRAIRSAAPADVELKSFGGGNAVQTPVSPIIRQAIRAAVAGDRGGFDQAVTRATRVKMDLSGLDEKAARKSVISSIEARDPARLALGKTPSPEEEGRITAGMTGSQRAAYQGAKTAFGSIKSWTRKPKAPKKGRRRVSLASKIRARRKKSLRPRVSLPANF